MKNHHIIIRLLPFGLAVFALPLGTCKKAQEKPPAPATSYSGGSTPTESATQRTVDRAKETASNAADAIKDGTASAWADLKDATYDQRVKFRDGMNRLADNVDTRVAALKQRSANLSEDGMEKLREARATLKEKLADLGDSSATNWDKAKAAVADAWERVEQSVRNLEQKAQS